MNRGVLYMLISTFAFSFMQVCVKYLQHIPTFELVFFRSLLTIIFSLTYLKMNGIAPLGNNRKILFLRGLFGMMALTMFFYTLKVLPLATAVIIQYLSPIFTVIIAIFFLGERMRKVQWLFFLIAFVGVALIKGYDERVSLTYLGIGLLSSLFAGAAYNCIRKLKDTDHPVVVVFYFPLVATPVMAVLSIFNWTNPSWSDFGIILLLGIFTQIGQVYMTKALQAEKASIVASLKYLGSIYALIYSYLIFDETYGVISLVGILLVLLGVVANITWNKLRPTD
jgi:drug/metabolite transporter (DMT)-like permease